MNNTTQGSFSLLRAAFNTVVTNPIILYPFFILACIHLLFLEIIYFTPRYPLSEFFGSIINKTAGPAFMHYPYNYLLLSKWYYGIETIICVFISCIFYGAAVLIIALIEGGQEINLKKVFQQILSLYVHLVAAMILAVILLKGLSFLHGLAFNRALLIESTTGIYFLIKKTVIVSAPYLPLLFSCFVFSFFAFVVPIIVIEQKKIAAAVKLNFRNYRRFFGLIFGMTLISGLLYLPFILSRSSLTDQWVLIAPEKSGLFLVLSILVMLLIDAIQYTAITLCYLLNRERQA